MHAHLKFMAKDMIRWIPFLGYGMEIIGTIFLKRDFEKDEKLLHSSFQSIGQNKAPCWVISFLEGTRYTPTNMEASRNFARERNLEAFKESCHVMVPRVKGFNATVRYLHKYCKHVKYIYEYVHITRK